MELNKLNIAEIGFRKLFMFCLVALIWSSSAVISYANAADCDLYWEIRNNGIDKVKKCLKNGSSANSYYHGVTMLSHATKAGFHEVMKLLIKHDADPNLANTNPGKESPILWAVRNNDFKALDILIDAGAIPNAISLYNYTPLIHAALANNVSMVKKLLSLGADIDHQNDGHDNGGTALHRAAQKGHFETVKVLIEAGADVNAINSACQTPIFLSAPKNYLDIVKLLLQNKAFVNLHARSESGWTYSPITMPWNDSRPEIASLIKKKGVILESSPKEGCSIVYVEPRKPEEKSLFEIKVFGLPPKGGSNGEPSDVEITDINPDTPFRVELVYENPPDDPPFSINSRWNSGSKGFLVSPTPDEKIFRSDWHVLRSDSYFQKSEERRLAGSAEKSATVASELFAGDWDVIHSGRETGDAYGIARVSKNGNNIRLILNGKSEAKHYESIEILATKDSNNKQHILEVRFKEISKASGWDAVGNGQPNTPYKFYIPDDSEYLVFEVDDSQVDLDVNFDSLAMENFRVLLRNRSKTSIRMSGGWNIERSDGSLGSGGQQTWGKAPEIKGIVVLEDQRPEAKKLGSFSDYQSDQNPQSNNYIHSPLQNDANRKTDYPFRDNALNDSKKRTLLVYGNSLPETNSDALTLNSNDKKINYELLSFPGEGKDGLFKLGWEKHIARGGNAKDAETYSSLLLTANLTEGVVPGIKDLMLNAGTSPWHLDFPDANVFLQFSHRWREHEETGAGEYETTEILYIGNEVFLTIEEQSPIPHQSLTLNLLVNRQVVQEITATRSIVDKRCQSDSVSNQKQKQRIGCEPAYITPPIKLYSQSLVEAGLSDRSTEQEEVGIYVNPGDRIEAELKNPYKARSLPVRIVARAVAGPGELGEVWKNALRRTAICHGENDVDFDTITGEQADTFSRFILTENLLEIMWPQFFGLPKSRQIELSKGDQAAAILIRDEFLKTLDVTIPQLLDIASNDEKMWGFYQTHATSDMPFWDIVSVEEPGIELEGEIAKWLQESGNVVDEKTISDYVKEFIDNTPDFIPDAKEGIENPWAIGQVVDYLTNYTTMFKPPGRAHGFAMSKTREALRSMIDLASNAYARAKSAGDCNLEELMLIAGQDAEQLVAAILPRLVRKADENSDNAWEADFVAQGFVSSLKVKGEAIRSLESYSKADNAYKMMALAGATAGVAAILTAGGAAAAGGYVMLGADAADALLFGMADYNQYLKGQPMVEYAQGATAGGLSDNFYNQAMAMKTEGWEAALGLLAPAIGMATGVSAIGDALAAKRGARLLGNLDSLDKSIIDALTPDQQKDLFSYFGDLQQRRPGNSSRDTNNLGRTHNLDEANDYSKFVDHFENEGVIVSGDTIRRKLDSGLDNTSETNSLDDLFQDSTASGNASSEAKQSNENGVRKIDPEAETVIDRPKTNQVETEPTEVDRPRTEKVETEPTEVDRPKTNQVETKPTEVDRPRTEKVETEPTEVDRPRTEKVETESTEVDRPRTEKVETEPTEVDRPRTEKVETEPTEVDRPRTEKVETEPTEVDRPRTEKVETEPTEVDRPKTNQVEAEPTEVDRPRTEKVETEPTEVDRPRTEKVETESTEVDRPRTEKVETEPTEVDRPKTNQVETERTEVDRPKINNTEEQTELVKIELPEGDLVPDTMVLPKDHAKFSPRDKSMDSDVPRVVDSEGVTNIDKPKANSIGKNNGLEIARIKPVNTQERIESPTSPFRNPIIDKSNPPWETEYTAIYNNNSITFTGKSGETVTVDLIDGFDNPVARGGFSRIHNTDNKNTIAKSRPLVTSGDLDDVIELARGRKLLESIEKPESYFRVTKQNEASIVTIDGNKHFVVIEENIDSVVDGQTIRSAKDRFKNRVPTLAERLTRQLAVREINRNGIAWTDHKPANYDIVPVGEGEYSPTGYKMIIFDTDGFVPMKGATPHDRFTNARHVQREYDKPWSGSFARELSADSSKILDRIDRRAFDDEHIAILSSPGANRGNIEFLILNSKNVEQFSNDLENFSQQIGRKVSLPEIPKETN